MPKFQLQADFAPAGDQEHAIAFLSNGVQNQQEHQVLLGITGSGKTFTMANVIQKVQLPTLIIAHNKTLAAQLFKEFKAFFPENAVEYFVSFYDYYQPEAYVPNKDLYIEKDTSLNDELERLRLSATRSLMEREDVIIVSSVSCIYGLGSPEEYGEMIIYLQVTNQIPRDDILQRLIELQYERNDYDFHRSTFRVRGDVIEVFMAEAEYAVRIEMFGDEIEAIHKIDPLTGKTIETVHRIVIYPSSHYVTSPDHVPETIRLIQEELEQQLTSFQHQGKLLEAQRLSERVRYDIEMIEQVGFCSGIENYSRILQRRKAGVPPPTLLDYFPKNSLLFIDESHVSIPQIRGMYAGDRSRKTTLVEHGFRLPSALDNRPLQFEEFEAVRQKKVYVSATPGDYELLKAEKAVVEQIIRPTGLLDPQVEIRPVMGQVDDMLDEIRNQVAQKERVLITTLTKRMAEDLTEYYDDLDVKVRYMHSDIDTVERMKILSELRAGLFDVLIGINLLREGLDLPEVSLVGIFDADKEGFLRSKRSLIQTFGRAARNQKGRVIMYADQVTASMKQAMEITYHRRKQQQQYNQEHGIIPTTIHKQLELSLVSEEPEEMVSETEALYSSKETIQEQIEQLQQEMKDAAIALAFERAAELRDQIAVLQKQIA